MQMSTKSETPRDFWEVLGQFWAKPDRDFINKWIVNQSKGSDQYVCMQPPSLGKPYNERWEGTHERANLSEMLKQPEGFGVDQAQEGLDELQSLAMSHHTVAQRMMAAMVQLPSSAA